MPGRLFGIGVGPGDPELLTLKALRVLKEAATVFVAASSKNSYSLAAAIIKPHLPRENAFERLDFPMTYERERLEAAWQENAQKVAHALEDGDVAFVTLGDPSFYSTFSYLARAVKKLLPEVEIEIVPGITAAQAAAARLKIVLSEGEETVLFASGAKGGEVIRKFGDAVDTLVLYKVYRRAEDIYEALKEKGLLEKACGISLCTLPEERIYKTFPSPASQKFPYFTLFIVGGKPIK